MKKLILVFAAIFFVVASLYAASQQTSSTTANTIIQNARALVNEVGTGFVSDAQMLIWVNDGTREIVRKTKCLEATKEVSMVADTVEYVISGVDFYGILGAVYNNPNGLVSDEDKTIKGLKLGNPWAVGHNDEEEPNFWYQYGNNIGIYPPLATVSGQTVTVFYVSRPTAVVTSESVLVPAQYDQVLTKYVAAQFYLRSRQMAKYDQLMKEIDAELKSIRIDYDRGYKEPEMEAR